MANLLQYAQCAIHTLRCLLKLVRLGLQVHERRQIRREEWYREDEERAYLLAVEMKKDGGGERYLNFRMGEAEAGMRVGFGDGETGVGGQK